MLFPLFPPLQQPSQQDHQQHQLNVNQFLQLIANETQVPVPPFRQPSYPNSEEEKEDDTAVFSFQQFCEDDRTNSPTERTAFILGVCMSGVIDGFSMDLWKESPWAAAARTMKPTRSSIMKEVRRRDPEIKNIRNTNISQLLDRLKESTFDHMTQDDLSFALEEYSKIKNSLKMLEDEKKARDTGSRDVNISFIDRLRYIKCLVSDDVKSHYMESQRSLSSVKLDNRSTAKSIVGFIRRWLKYLMMVVECL